MYKTTRSKRPQKKTVWLDLTKKLNWRHLGYFLGFVVILQILYPQNLAPPNARLSGHDYGWQSRESIAKKIDNQFKQTSVKIVADDSEYAVGLSEIGGSIGVDELSKQLTSYEWWQRIVPFSLFFVGRLIDKIQIDFDDSILSSSVSSIESKLVSDPKEGSIMINNDGEIIIDSAKNGVSVETDDIKEGVRNHEYAIGTSNSLDIKAKVTKPKISNESLHKTQAEVVLMSTTKITLTNSLTNKVSNPSNKDILSWLKIEGNTKIGFNEEAIKFYLNQVAKESIKAPGTTTIVIVDGKETKRSVGSKGLEVDVEPIVKSIEEALSAKSGQIIKIGFKESEPKIVYDRTYNHSEKALQAYVNEVAATGAIEISVKQLNGNGWSASSKAGNSVVSASTYKLFIAMLLFKKINSGNISWTDSIQGTDVKNCLRNTIVLSANNCSEQWIKDWGRRNVNSNLYALGFSTATNFAASDATHTSASDLQKLLIGLYNKTLFNASDASHLIGLMKQQVYRRGIPAGSGGTVADKVGFLWGYLNDAAIVYHPKGTYALVIMTNNQSWAKIAEITRKIESIMYGTD